MQKDFYKITELTKECEETVARFNAERKENRPNTMEPGDAREWQLYLMTCQMQVQLAIAQQLTMVAQHLGALVSMVKDEANRKGQG